jgi:hypothetical protein
MISCKGLLTSRFRVTQKMKKGAPPGESPGPGPARFMMDGFYQGRGIALKLMVAVILIIELVFLFREKS